MSKYNLSDLLNEVQGGKIATLNISAKELIDKMEDVEAKGIDIDRYDGLSADGKTHLEFHVHPEGRDEPDASFSVYDYKFGLDPTDEDNFMTEYPFSVGGKGGYALKMAQELVGAEAYRMEEEKKELPKSIADKEKAEIEKDAKKATGAMKEANEDYDLLKIKKEIRFHLDTYEKGIIDGDDLAQAVEEVVFGEIKAPGTNTDADFEREQRAQLGMREEESVDEAVFGPVKFLKSKGIDDDVIKDFMKMHAKDIVGASEDEIMDEFKQFRSANYDYVDEDLKEHFGRFLKDYQ